MKYDNFTVGRCIRNLRIEEHMTINDLAERVDRSPAHLNMIELGGRNMSVELIFKIMDVFHTDANSILGVGPKGDIENSIDYRLSKFSPDKRAKIKKSILALLDSVA